MQIQNQWNNEKYGRQIYYVFYYVMWTFVIQNRCGIEIIHPHRYEMYLETRNSYLDV